MLSADLRPTQLAPTMLHDVVARIAQLQRTPPAVRGGTDAIAVRGVAQASQLVRPDDLYLALPGARFHGADFAAVALEAGARAIVTDTAGAKRLHANDMTSAAHTGEAARPGENVPVIVVDDPRALAGPIAALIYGDPSARLPIIGVTGTNGKTTTAYLVDAALRAAGHITALIGTIETRVAGAAVPSARTTPEAAELQGLYAYAAERGVTAIVMEASSHGLALGRLAATQFAVGIFTNLSVDHLDLHGSMADYFAAKARLFDGRARHAVINVDDEYGRTLVDRAQGQRQTVAIHRAADWRVTAVQPARFSQQFTLTPPSEPPVAAAVQLPGEFNVANAALAIAGVAVLGVPPAVAAAGIAGLAGVPGRMERVPAPPEVLAVVDYAHAPDGVAAALAALRPVTPGRLLVVLGCGGDRDAGKRPLMGAAAAAGADIFLATDDNPRSEPPAAIRAAMLAGVAAVPDNARATIIEIDDRRAAIAEAARLAVPGDTVAILGKGHEAGQEIAGVKQPFDDRVEWTNAVAALTGPAAR